MNQLIDRVKEDLNSDDCPDNFADYYLIQNSSFSPQLYFLALLHGMDGTEAVYE